MYDVLTIGDSNHDIFIWLDEKLNQGEFCFVKGTKNTIQKTISGLGGSACNVAVGLARLGLKVGLVSAIGRDSWAEKIKKTLGQEGVATSYLRLDPKSQSSFSVIMMSESGERTILVYHGLVDYGRLKIPQVKTRWLYLSPLGENWQELYQKIMPLVSEQAVQLAVNPGARQLKMPAAALRRLLRVTRLLFVNEQEARQLAGVGATAPIKEVIGDLRRTDAEIVVVTAGKRGAWAADSQRIYFQEAENVQMIDATGAGDAFASGFLTAIIKSDRQVNQPVESALLKQALRWGVANGAAVVRQLTAQTGLLTKLS